MKAKIILLAAMAATIASSNAAITIGSTAIKNVQGSDSTDLVSGRLGLLIVDTDSNGFLNGYTSGAIVTNPLLAPQAFSATGAGLTLGSTFLGDLVLARLTTTVGFGDTTIAGAFSGSIAGLESKNYAIVWFETLNTAGGEATATGKFGIARGADWALPAADVGAFTFGTGASNLDQLTLGPLATAAANQGVSFATNGTSLAIVPEPSAVLLGAIGALGLLRRRRN